MFTNPLPCARSVNNRAPVSRRERSRRDEAAFGHASRTHIIGITAASTEMQCRPSYDRAAVRGVEKARQASTGERGSAAHA
jgi:hypothetical protein